MVYKSSISNDIRLMVSNCYSEPHRKYHTKTHLANLLYFLSDFKDMVDDPLAIEIAMYFHDAIYEIRDDAQNEERSAAWMREVFNSVISEEHLGRAERMILATKKHLIPEICSYRELKDLCFFLDADMMILAAPSDMFMEYEEGIAGEYVPIYGRIKYLKARIEILKKFLARERIFFTDWIYDKHEETARDNISGLITDLENELDSETSVEENEPHSSYFNLQCLGTVVNAAVITLDGVIGDLISTFKRGEEISSGVFFTQKDADVIDYISHYLIEVRDGLKEELDKRVK